VYFDTNRVIADTLSGSNGFPVPRVPVAMPAVSVS
jgi:hypothetical protein